MNITAWSLLSVTLTYFQNAPRICFIILSAMNVTSVVIVSVVSSAYWLLMPSEMLSTDLCSINQHGILAIITFVDMLTSAAPIRFFHIFACWFFAGAYATFTYLSYIIEGNIVIIISQKLFFITKEIFYFEKYDPVWVILHVKIPKKYEAIVYFFCCLKLAF